MLDLYYKAAKFLPFINNELPQHRNATYAARFSSIQRLALIKVRTRPRPEGIGIAHIATHRLSLKLECNDPGENVSASPVLATAAWPWWRARGEEEADRDEDGALLRCLWPTCAVSRGASLWLPEPQGSGLPVDCFDWQKDSGAAGTIPMLWASSLGDGGIKAATYLVVAIRGLLGSIWNASLQGCLLACYPSMILPFLQL